MSFSNRKFDFYILFGDNPKSGFLWTKEFWTSKTEPLLNQILDLSVNKIETGLKVLEYDFKNTTDKYRGELKFGQLKWDKKSHNKWILEKMTPNCLRILNLGHQNGQFAKKMINLQMFLLLSGMKDI